jgi:hypothetical protein
LVRETGFEAFLMNLGLDPNEWLGVGVVGFDEGIDGGSELFDRGEGFTAQESSPAESLKSPCVG